MRNASRAGRFTPLHPRLAAAGFRAALPLAERFLRHKDIHRPNSQFAAERSRDLVARLARGETAYLVGISIGGFHNTGVALVEVTPAGGPRIICNNEEERFSGRFWAGLSVAVADLATIRCGSSRRRWRPARW